MSQVKESIQPVYDALLSFAHHPNAIGSPYPIAAGVLIAGAVKAFEWRRYKPEAETGIAHESTNPALLRQTEIDVESGRDTNKTVLYDKWYQLGSRVLMAGGIGLLGGTVLANTEYATTSVNNAANTIALVDSSNAMVDSQISPTDGTSIFTVAQESLKAAKVAGNFGELQFGMNTNVSSPLAAKTETSLNNVSPNAVDNNGADLATAMTTAANLFPGHEGTEIIISNGYITSDPTTLQNTINTLTNEGVKFDVIEPNYSTAKYKLETGPALSAAGFNNVLASFGNKVKVDTTTPQIKSTISSAIAEASKSEKEHFWYPALLGGAAVAVWGYLRDGRQRRRKQTAFNLSGGKGE